MKVITTTTSNSTSNDGNRLTQLISTRHRQDSDVCEEWRMPRPSEAILCIVAMLAQDVNGQAPRVALQVGDWQSNSFRKSGGNVERAKKSYWVTRSFMSFPLSCFPLQHQVALRLTFWDCHERMLLNLSHTEKLERLSQTWNVQRTEWAALFLKWAVRQDSQDLWVCVCLRKNLLANISAATAFKWVQRFYETLYKVPKMATLELWKAAELRPQSQAGPNGSRWTVEKARDVLWTPDHSL